jgi:hypothetical protein
LSASDKGFTPPAPFTLDEMDERGLLPDRVYTKEELLTPVYAFELIQIA